MKSSIQTLPNGLKVMYHPMASTQALTLLVLVRTGSRYEIPRTNGISHFLEHMMFKGTKRRPEALDITRELDGVGAEYNAFTTKDHTGFYVKIDAHHSALAVDILSDILLNSLMPQAEIDKERTVVVEEINMYEDNPSMSIDDIFEQLLYQPNSLGWLISGPRENILKNIKREDIVAYYRHWYQPRHMIVALAGHIPANLPKMVTRVFSVLEQEKKTGKPFPRWNGTMSKQRIAIKWKQTEQVHLALGCPTYAQNDKRLPALRVLSAILGGNMSSRLFVSVREKRGLAYMIRSGVTAYQDAGNIMIHAGLDKSRIQEAIKVILDELRALRQTGVSAEELVRGKEFLVGKVALQLEDSSAIAQWYGTQQLLRGSAKTPEQVTKEIRAVTQAQILKVSNELFQQKNLRMAIIGPYKDSKPFEKLLA